MMKIEKASYKALKYASLKFHYAKRVPQAILAYSVFNDEEWCGVVSFSYGIGKNVGTSYGLGTGEILELSRVALNGKQTRTSEVVAMCLRRLHKDCPQVRLVVSYADADQKHLGTIYQATNWIYVGAVDVNKKDRDYTTINGGKLHNLELRKKWQKYKTSDDMTLDEYVNKFIDPNAKREITAGKRKYLMPMDKKMRRQIEPLRKPYPKTDEDWQKIDRSIFKDKKKEET